MNRKQRRAQEKAGSARPQTAADLEQLFSGALEDHQAGRLLEAEQRYRHILAVEPQHADALHLLGVIAHQVGRNDVAVELMGKAIGIDGCNAVYYSNLGVALKALGRFDDALAACEAAVRLELDYAEAFSNLGVALTDLERFEDAVAACTAAIRLKPDYAEAFSNLAVALTELGRSEDAVAACDSAIRLKPDYAEAFSNLGNALKNLGRLEHAVVACNTAIRLKPDLAEAHYGLANALKDLGRMEEAVAAYDRAIHLKPDYAKAYSNLGHVLTGLDRLEDSIAAFNAAIGFKPDLAEAHLNASLSHFLLGDFAAAWPKFEWRWRGGTRSLQSRGFSQPQWRGEDITGRVILLHAEQGMGDTIQFCRYAALVAARGGRVILEAPRSLLRMLSRLEGVDRLIAAGDPLPDFDFHCPLMSLPGVFRTTVETIPATTPYLKAEAEALDEWRTRIGPSGFKIGITWQGNPTAAAEQGRSAPLASFAPLARVPGVRLISLQKVHGLDQLNQLPPGMQVETLGSDFDVGPDAFVDTAAAMMSLDLIITVDTAIGHLAGALGRPVWLALQAVPHWVWMMDREDTPWYPNTRLFRQSKRGDWDGVFGRMEAELRSLTMAAKPSAQTVAVPVAFGELIDKITILEIKRARIKEPDRLRNIEHEYRLLLDLWVAAAPDDPRLSERRRALQAVNETIWQIEDDIRDHERRGDFGPGFIALARAVYQNNDRRAAIKREFNQWFNSAIVEEKSYTDYAAV